jgi:hypothetical protein
VSATREITNVNRSLQVTPDEFAQAHDHHEQPHVNQREIPAPMTIADMVQDFPELRPPVVDNVVREGETLNIIAPSKRGKTWTIIALVLSIVSGRCWLDRFACRKCRVLLLDNELHPPTLARRYKTVISALGMTLAQVGDDLDVIPLRGRLATIHDIHRFVHQFPPRFYGAVVIDALYRVLPEGCDENKNADMAAVYNVLDSIADHLQCAVIIVHHSSKGIQGSKSITDTGAGAGSISRATDTHLVLRDHEETGAVVLETASRSFPPLAPFCMRWTFPTWTLAADLDPLKIKTDRPKRGPKIVEKKVGWTVDSFVEKFISADPCTPSAISIQAAACEPKLPDRLMKRLLEASVDAGKVHRWEPSRKTQPVRYSTEPQPLLALVEGKGTANA